MQNMSFKITEVIKESFTLVQGKKGPAVLCAIGSILVFAVMTFLFFMVLPGDAQLIGVAHVDQGMYGMGTQAWLVSNLFYCAQMFVYAPFIAALAMIGLKSVRKEPVSKWIAFQYVHQIVPVGLILILYAFTELFLMEGVQYALSMWGVDSLHAQGEQGVVLNMSVVFLLLVVGLFQLFVSAIIYCTFQLSIFFVLDQNLSPLESIKHAFEVIKRHGLKWVGLYFVLALLMLLGIVTLIGWLWVLPMTYISFGIVYQRFIDQGGSK
jgi:hypothetical protein